MEEHSPEEVLARFEELTVLESEFEDVEIELIRKSHALNAPLYKKRTATVANIPHFWALVFEMAPPEVDNFIQPSDSTVFAECLETLEVSRFEIDDPKGSPRSFSIKFGFKENAYFANRTLEKKFWFRSSLDGWQGLVSEPVQIMWKKGKDLTEGLTDAAYRLSIATQKLSLTDPKARGLPEYKSLASKVESSEEASNSFFAWFGFVSSYKWVSAEESEKANKIEAERMEKRRRGEKVEDDDDDEDDDMEQDFQETEVFPGGDELATILAEDMWPSAIKYYKQAHEADEEDDEDLSELEIDMEDEDDSDGDEIDIRGLVGKGRNKGSDLPPAKKQRKA